MIDPQVAFDKLAQFETPNELAEYLKTQGFVGRRSQVYSCPIANYMKTLTEFEFAVDTFRIDHWASRTKFITTTAIRDFVTLFDSGYFPELETYEENYDEGEL